ncbi:MAG: LysM peptidoglycan-binding domain-containing protein [Gammaproteobacteria bacterium]|nr:LysM peptidoglycan-binding domain-containing protein [Gammaproteobacteria bacterium]MBU1505975.1 LysM peptidoglycan-binding domain-containing protein [Gammaproteobacteria bacterium]MBU1818861.1 LysM peptidoglycan-binding domain-containing protein [Gammaproteobacteria bacterium]MBU2120391.1 LysM peptidoglycan-binding domain-containing protein [Gammaproteobacteria bacterium]MBU2169242.1 LysM peptidoglycan-binding domain-containing protein [Gammaproteobacteria bacterium]
MTAFTSVQRTALGALTIIAGAMLVAPAQAQNFPISGGQRATAQQVSERGIPLSELAPNAPDSYTVKRGDTLWGISGMYLLRPYRWPELWGMNLKAIPNPHLIFPGQTLYLDKADGYARLRTSPSGQAETVRVSPRTRSDSLMGTALPTLKPHLIEPFLVEPVVVDASVLERAPRIVATTEERVLMAHGDRAYARGIDSAPLRVAPGEQRYYRVYRNAVPLKDPVSGEILGYEAQYLGKAELVRGETTEDVPDGKGGFTLDKVPATVDISGTKEEIRAGDRLLAEPGRGYVSYTPQAPQRKVDARVVSIYGESAVAYAAQNQVVSINLGARDGLEPGHVLSILSKGERIKDTTSDSKEMIKLPAEANGMAMVFRTFDRVSYVLILDVRNGVRVGDRLVNPE